ncbi:hypothetical protein HA402_004772 [Bradysia odoriphaga]|nr:hypothetical protein HA402_004772 [Bradysia odoriphaga]
MDRRKLHKVNGQAIGKNRQISSRTRANNRAANQDAQRAIEPEEPVPVKLSRLERMKLWRLERDEKKKEEEQKKKKPFVTVVKRGVFLDKTNYAELNKQRRKRLNSTNTGPKLPVQVQNEAVTTDNNVSRRGRGVNIETEVVRTDNDTDNAGLLAIPDNTSALNSTFETSEASEVVENSARNVHFIATPSSGGNMLTVSNVTPQLNTTFEMENSAENNGTSETNDGEDQPAQTTVGDVDMLTVPNNTSVLNTTFEMENSVENNEASEPATIGVSNLLATVKSENVPEGRRPSIRSTLKSIKSEDVSEGRRPTIKSTPKSVKSENIPEGETSSIESTPKSVLSTSLTYVSPFVTISRGKGSAQKEVRVRESFYKLELSQSKHDSPAVRQNRAAADYFRGQVNSETNSLMQKVEYWTQYKAEHDHIDSVYVDQIDVAIGQTRLLITKKFKQFLGLCDDCEKGTSQPPVLAKDLEGFWSMVYMQVENCGLRFQKLMTLQENDWVEADSLPAKVIKQTKNKKAAKKGGVASSGIQKMIEEARIKMKESKIAATATSSR